MRRLMGCLAICALLTLMTYVLAGAGRLERLGGVLNDTAFPRGAPDPSVLVVGIDDRSIAAEVAGWPWSREDYADLVTALGDAGAELVVLDVILEGSAEGDDALVAAMHSVPTGLVLAPRTAAGQKGRPLTIGGAAEPPSELRAAAAFAAHSQVIIDPADGIVRRVPLVVATTDGPLISSLSLAAFAHVHGADPSPILRRPDGVQMGERIIPTDGEYLLRLSWPVGLPPTFAEPGPVISAADVLSGRVGSKEIDGKVVLVGVTDPTLGDHMSTPVDKRTPDAGVTVHAAALHTMLSQQFVIGPQLTETVVWVAILTLLAALCVQFLPLPAAVAASGALLAVSLFGPLVRIGDGVMIHSVYPLAATAVAIPLSGGLRYGAETRLRRRVSALFARYVPPPVAAELTREGRLDDALVGQWTEVTLMFCDMRSFTPMAANMEPVEINRVLSHYYEYVSSKVLDAGGTIIQYVGDEVFAIFGAPLHRSDHAVAGLSCALEVQSDRELLESTLVADGLPPVRFGIGVNSGEVVATHAGSSFRRQYAVVGDPVNVGSRLCSEAGPGEVVAASSTVEAAEDAVDLPSGERYHPTLKGVDRTMTAWRFRPSIDDPADSSPTK